MSKKTINILCFVLMLMAVGLSGCSSSKKPEGKEISEQQIVNDPGVATAVNLVIKNINRQNVFEGKKEYSICFLGVRGTNGQEIPPVSDNVRVYFAQADNFHLVSPTKVEEAFEASKVKRNNVFIPAERRKFLDSLGGSVDYIVQGKLEIGSNNSSSVAPGTPPQCMIVLELFKLNDNTYSKEMASVERDYSYMSVATKGKKFGLF